MNRREFLYGVNGGLGALAFHSMLQAEQAKGPLAPKAAHFPKAKAKRCIFLYMAGGPSHIDTFDPKPKLKELHLQKFKRSSKFLSAMGSGDRYYVQSPFKFNQANMSDCLWFAEGFTSYYTNLILERAGVISAEDYINGLNGTFNYVWNSPALQYFNPIEMSNQAPFVDAATSVDPVNRENMFISYYSYGSVLGLALDLSLREKNLNLDEFMQLMWKRFGKTEVAYTVKDIEATLADYAGAAFAQDFFGKYIYKSEMPNYKNLFEQVGLQLNRATAKPYFGASFSETSNGLEISRNTFKGSPAYQADLDKGDLITSIDGIAMTSNDAFKELLSNKNIDDVLQVTFERFGEEHKTKVRLTADPTFTIAIDNNAKKEAVKAREAWLAKK